jgi:hypothetical protein
MILVPIFILACLTALVIYANVVYWRGWYTLSPEERAHRRQQERDDLSAW